MSDTTPTTEQNADIQILVNSKIEAAETLKAIKDSYAEYIKKMKQVDILYSKFETLRDNVENEETGISALHASAAEIKNEIDKMNVEGASELKNIKENVSALKEKIEEAESYYERFKTFKGQADDKETGLVALFESSKTFKTEIEEIKESCTTFLSEIEKANDSLAEHVEEIEDFYTETFLPLKAKVIDPTTGIEKTLSEIDELHKTSSKLHTKIGQLADSATKSKSNVDSFAQSSEQQLKDIEGIKDKSENFKNEIGKILELVTDSGLADAYQKRKNDLTSGVDKWFKALVGSAISLILGVGILYYTLITNTSSFEIFIYRLTLISPLLLITLYAAREYSKERTLLEEYAFKATTGATLRAYTELLSDKFPEPQYKEKIISFVIDSIKSVYVKPNMLGSRMKFGIFGKSHFGNMELGTEIADSHEAHNSVPAPTK